MEVIDGIQKNVPVLAEHHHLLVRLEDVGVAEDRRVVGEDAALLYMIGTRSTSSFVIMRYVIGRFIPVISDIHARYRHPRLASTATRADHVLAAQLSEALRYRACSPQSH